MENSELTGNKFQGSPNTNNKSTQENNIQQMSLRTLMELLKDFKLPKSLLNWNAVIWIQTMGSNNLDYTWIIKNGEWNILEGIKEEANIVFRGYEMQLVNHFTKAYDPDTFDGLKSKHYNPFKCGTFTSSILLYFRGLSPQLIAEAEQRNLDVQVLKDKEKIDPLINDSAQEGESKSGNCPKCKSNSIATVRLLVNPINGEKIAESDLSKGVELISLIGGFLLLAFGLFLLIPLLINWGDFPVNPFFAIAATAFLIINGVKAFRYGSKLRYSRIHKNEYKLLIQNTCKNCRTTWNEDNKIIDG